MNVLSVLQRYDGCLETASVMRMCKVCRLQDRMPEEYNVCRECFIKEASRMQGFPALCKECGSTEDLEECATCGPDVKICDNCWYMHLGFTHGIIEEESD